MAQFSCTSLKEQGAEERGCTKDFSHVLKLLYFLGNKAMLIQHFLCDLYSIRPAAIDITLSKTVINFQQRKIDLYLEYLSPFSGQEGRSLQSYLLTVLLRQSSYCPKPGIIFPQEAKSLTANNSGPFEKLFAYCLMHKLGKTFHFPQENLFLRWKMCPTGGKGACIDLQ